MRRFPIPRTTTIKLDGALLAILHDKGLKGTVIIRYISIFQRALVPYAKKYLFNFGTLTLYNLCVIYLPEKKSVVTFFHNSYISTFQMMHHYVFPSVCSTLSVKFVRTKFARSSRFHENRRESRVLSLRDVVTRSAQRFHLRSLAENIVFNS